jgi:hypothetical protein
MERFGKFMAVNLLGVVTTVFRGWVLTKLWAWFVVPLGAQQLSVVSAVGCMFIVNLALSGLAVTQLLSGPKKSEEPEWWAGSILSAFASLLVLVYSWIWHFFL